MSRGNLPVIVYASILILAVANAQNNADYQCSCSGVSPPCVCPSSSPPGGLSPTSMPMFIVVTNDDAVTSTSDSVIRSITSDAHRNPNGCPAPATWFVSIEYSEPARIARLYSEGHEIATHTLTHPSQPSLQEIGGARDWLVNEVGIPAGEITGFRSPFLAHTTESRGFLHQLGFRYDSSITEQASQWSGTSPSETSRVFPYTLQNGVAQNCDIGTGTCEADEQYPGMWELPMWLLEDAQGVPVSAMDIPAGLDAFETLKVEFDTRYNSNRAPLGVFLHAAQVIAGDHGAKINEFFRYAGGHDDVWFVTSSQLLDYMTHPRSAAEYASYMSRERQCGARSTFDASSGWSRVAQPMYQPGSLQTAAPTPTLDPITWAPTQPPTTSPAPTQRASLHPPQASESKATSIGLLQSTFALLIGATATAAALINSF